MKICIIEHGDTKSYRITANGHTITCNITELLYQGHFAKKYLNSVDRMWMPIRDWRGTVDAALAQATKESR